MNDYSDLARLLELIESLAPGAQGPGDPVFGTYARDVIRVSAVPVFALGGNDVVFGSAGVDSVAAGAGDDYVSGGDGRDILLGGTGDDTIIGGLGALYAEGGDGDDVVIGDALADTIDAGLGNDTVRAGAGNDIARGGLGDDLLVGDVGLDYLLGDAGDDFINAGFGRDTVFGGSGADVLRGEDGIDELSGNTGDDRIFGGLGNDVLDGGYGDDIVQGGAGSDRILAGAGTDTILGGLGSDTLVLSGDLGDYRFENVGQNAVRIVAKDGSGTSIIDGVETVVDADGDVADPAGTVTLQLLHASDFEGNTDAIGKAANFAQLIDFFEEQYATTLFLSSGDNFIPSPFSAAQAADAPQAVRDALNAVLNEVMSEVTGIAYDDLETAQFRADVAILNAMGLDASAIGNHDFDLNQQGLLNAFAESGDWVGALFPYLSANMTFEAESVLNPYRDADGIQLGEDSTGVIAPYTLIEQNGETFGYIGVTTQILSQISSTFGDPDNPNDDISTGNANDMAALAAIIQPIVDDLEAQGVNKIILSSHLQQIGFEQALAPLLTGVDIMIGGGSDAIFADADDYVKSGDNRAQDYPQVLENADGEDVLLVNTDGQYNYVGRLVVEFDAGGNIIAGSVDDDASGPFATDDIGMDRVFGNGDGTFTDAERAAGLGDSQKGQWVKQITDAIADAIQATSGNNFFADQDVDLNGNRNPGVRTEETNLGNLTADANLWYANDLADAPVLMSIKNGGGIRANILNDDGKISELDIRGALAFNNNLSLVTITTDQLLEVLNYGVAASVYNDDGTAPGGTEQGRFPQISGVRFSFDPDQAAGTRVQDVWLTNAAGTEVKLFEDGVATSAASQFAAGIRVVTLDFMLTGGDGYPFQNFIAANPAFADVVNLYDDTNIAVGNAQFENVGTEQDAFAEYLAEFYGVDSNPNNDFAIADTGAADDTRIQNLEVPGVVDTDLPL